MNTNAKWIKTLPEIGEVSPEFRRNFSISKKLVKAEAYVSAHKCNRDFRCMSSLNADDLYYGIFMLGDEKCVVYFEATKQALKILKYYNRLTVVTETKL